MYNLPEVNINGLAELDKPLEILTIHEMWGQIKMYQPRIAMFLSTFMNQSGFEEETNSAIMICCWYVLAALSGQGKAEGECYYQTYNKLVDKWGISTPEELANINMASVLDEKFVQDSKYLISNLGEEKSMPIIEAASRSIQPDLIMVAVYYAITCMNSKHREKTTEVIPN